MGASTIFLPNGSAAIIKKRCNIFGEWQNGAKIVLGGQANPKNEKQQWYCPEEAIGRYRMACPHRHVGQIMDLCKKHVAQYAKEGTVRYCPACNTVPDEVDDEGKVLKANGHKCPIALYEVS